jgi:hypothetical protein
MDGSIETRTPAGLNAPASQAKGGSRERTIDGARMYAQAIDRSHALWMMM